MKKIDYSQLSDFEINMLVASNLKQITRILKPFVDNENKSVHVVKDGVWCWFNPCNNWSDAGPIIVENKIGVIPPYDEHSDKWVTLNKVDKIFGNVIECDIAYAHTNPLRAAMIVFLEMQK